MLATRALPLFLLAAVVGLTLLADRTCRLCSAAEPPPHTPAPAQSAPTTAPATISANVMFIDADGDGYGVGSPKGPDADDRDARINTGQSVLARNKSLEEFLPTIGYKPRRIIYLSPDGDDRTGRAGDVAKPYRTFARVGPMLQADDLVCFRQGTYGGDIPLDASGIRGRRGRPIIIMAFPGEQVILSGGGDSIKADRCSNLVFDGFVLDCRDKGSDSGFETHFASNITLRNMEMRNHFWGVFGMQDLSGLLLENLVIHDNGKEHGVYLGCRDLPNANLTIRGCLIYRNGGQGIQHNGRVKNLTIENNVIHSNGQAGVQFMQGVCKSTVRNNLIFNNAKQGICLYKYVSTDRGIAIFDQNDNIFEDNTIWVGTRDWQDQYPTATYPAIAFNDPTEGKQSHMIRNAFRRNILVVSEGPAVHFYQPRFADQTVFEGNLIHRQSGPEAVVLHGDKSYPFDQLARLGADFKDNRYADPRFAAATAELYLKPEKFDFAIDPDSPAKGLGCRMAPPAPANSPK